MVLLFFLQLIRDTSQKIPFLLCNNKVRMINVYKNDNKLPGCFEVNINALVFVRTQLN